MYLPWICSACKHQSWIDLERLEKWRQDNIVTAEGYTCGNCQQRVIMFRTTQMLEEKGRKIGQYRPEQPQFKYLFIKLLKKAMAIAERNDGTG